MPLGVLESLQENYGYPEDETRIPINTDQHDNCPYCGVALVPTAAHQPTLQMKRDMATAEKTTTATTEGETSLEKPLEKDPYANIKIEPASAKLVRILSGRPRK